MCKVTESSSLPAYSCCTKMYASFTDLKAAEGGQLYTLKDLDHLILPQDKLEYLRSFTDRINFPLRVLKIQWWNFTANRTGIYKTVFWILSLNFCKSERHS